MADIDLERLAALQARYGRPAKRSAAGVRSLGARFRAESKGLAATGDARRRRTIEASADGRSIREAFVGALRRSPRT